MENEGEVMAKASIGHTSDGNVIFQMECGFVGVSLILTPDHAIAVSDNLRNAVELLKPDTDQLIRDIRKDINHG